MFTRCSSSLLKTLQLTWNDSIHAHRVVIIISLFSCLRTSSRAGGLMVVESFVSGEADLGGGAEQKLLSGYGRLAAP
jgi:hypothetical protein